MKKNKALHMVAFTLLIVGGVNWGIVGFLGYDLVDLLVGRWEWVYNTLLTLVGVSAIYIAATHMSDCKVCSEK
jgi:uncharacterized membrane protein YuzA (DUF378 family)